MPDPRKYLFALRPDFLLPAREEKADSKKEMAEKPGYLFSVPLWNPPGLRNRRKEPRMKGQTLSRILKDKNPDGSSQVHFLKKARDNQKGQRQRKDSRAEMHFYCDPGLISSTPRARTLAGPEVQSRLLSDQN